MTSAESEKFSAGDAALFCAAIALFALPPVFARPSPCPSFEWTFPARQFFFAAFALLLLLKERGWKPPRPVRAPGFARRAFLLGNFLMAFGILCASAQLIGLAARAAGAADFSAAALPHGAREAAFAVLSFALSAFYEEALYRLYLPGAMARLLPAGKFFQALSEILPALLFALAHKYSGAFSIANAAIAAAALRACAKKTVALSPCVAAHFAYNCLALLLRAAESRMA